MLGGAKITVVGARARGVGTGSARAANPERSLLTADAVSKSTDLRCLERRDRVDFRDERVDIRLALR